MPASVARTIPSDPREWETSTADDALRASLNTAVGDGGYEVNAKYLAGDHGQDGDRWRGPGFDQNGRLSKKTWEGIRATSYVSVPVIEECVARRADAACAKEPEFSIAPNDPQGPEDDKGKRLPSPEQERYAAEWYADVGAWWAKPRPQSPWSVQKAAVRHASAGGQGCIRLFYNKRFRREVERRDGSKRSGIPPQPNRRAALNTIDFVAPPPNACGVWYEPDTLEPVGIYRYTTAEGEPGMELWFRDGEKTICRQVEGDKDSVEWRYDWGGVLPIVPLQITPILTQPVRELQAAADTAATCALRVTVTHGYPQRDEINVRPAGEMKPEPPSDDANPYTEVHDGVVLYLWKGFRELSASVTNNLFGIQTTKRVKDEGGAVVEEKEYQTPQVLYHEPSDPESVFEAESEWEYKIRAACRQGHIVSNGSTAEASGDAYEQKRAEFGSDVDNVALGVSGLNSGILTALSVMADELVDGSEPAVFVRDWSVASKVQADPGPVSSAKLRDSVTMVEKSILARSTVQIQAGVNDVATEMEAINTDAYAARFRAECEAVKAARDAGVNPVLAWKRLGYSDEDAAELARNDFLTEEEE
jgi:hypothetical protein